MLKSKIRVGIIGGGIGGLSLAILLSSSKEFEVTVFEQAPSYEKLGAGIHLAPNAMRILDHMGVGETIAELGDLPEAWNSRDLASGDVLFRMPLGAGARQKYGARYVTVHRGQFHTSLAARHGLDLIRFGKRLSKIVPTSEATSRLCFHDGSTHDVDVVIGADGIYSAVRQHLIEDDMPRFGGSAAHRFIVPRENLPEARIDEVTKWWGEDRYVLVYFIDPDRHSIYCVTGVPQEGWNSERSWENCSKASLQDEFSDAHGEIRRLIDAAPADGITKWATYEKEPLSVWSKGNVVLIGDACHPMKPHMGQGAAMALEDAMILSRCLKLAGADTACAFAMYEATRRERTGLVQNISASHYWLKDGGDPSWLYGYDAANVALVERVGQVSHAD